MLQLRLWVGDWFPSSQVPEPRFVAGSQRGKDEVAEAAHQQEERSAPRWRGYYRWQDARRVVSIVYQTPSTDICMIAKPRLRAELFVAFPILDVRCKVKSSKRRQPFSRPACVLKAVPYSARSKVYLIFFYPSELVSMDHYPFTRLRTSSPTQTLHIPLTESICVRKGRTCADVLRTSCKNSQSSLARAQFSKYSNAKTCSIQSKGQTCSWKTDKYILYPSVVLNGNTESVAGEGICLWIMKNI